MLHRLKNTCWVGALALGLLACSHSGKGTEKPTYSISMKVVEDLKKVGELAKNKKWEDALAQLDRSAERKYLNPYEQATLWAARAGIHFAMNKSDEMVKDMEQAVAPDAMPEAQQLDAMYNLGQAYFTVERFSEAADTFGKWAKRAPHPEPNQYYVIAGAYAQSNRFAEALPFAQKAVDAMKQPTESWLKLLISLHHELKQEAEVAAVQERLAQAFPTRENLLQLTATYQELGQNDKALATIEKANAKGVLTEEKDQLNLARLYMNAGTPLKGAALLDKQMKEGKVAKSAETSELLATLWVKGKDAAHAEPLFKQAGDSFASGDLYAAFGRFEAERGEWTKARDALASAMQKGDLSSPGSAHLLLGVAHYNTKRKDAALASFGEAKRYPDTAKCADEWIKAVKAAHAGSTPGCALAAGAQK